METDSKIRELLEGTGAIRYGHFVLSDGCHTDMEFRTVKVMQFPPHCRKVAYEIVKHYWDMDVQLVIACSARALLFAAEIARQLEARVIFADSPDAEEKVFLHKDFEIHSGDRAILVDDILTDQAPIMRALARKILMADARLIGVASLIDISSKPTTFNVRQISVMKLEPHFWTECPLCINGNAGMKETKE